MLFAGRFASDVMISWAACRASYPPQGITQEYVAQLVVAFMQLYACILALPGGALPGCCGVPEFGLFMG